MVLRKNISKGVEVMKSIDDATPEEWNALRKKPATPVADTWNNIYNNDRNITIKQHIEINHNKNMM